MKKITRILSTMIVFCTLLMLLPVTANAVSDTAINAYSRIDLYSQYGLKPGKSNDGNPSSYKYTQAPYLLTDGKSVGGYVADKSWAGNANCLAQGGCYLFAWAHAIEWVEGKHLGVGLLTDLLDYCVSPSNYYGHNYAGCKKHGTHSSSFYAYKQYAQTEKGIYVTLFNDKKFNRSALISELNAGCVLIVHVTNHYVCAVDYVICDANGKIIDDDGSGKIPSGGAFYVQIIDSAPTASAKAGRTFSGKIYEMSSDGKSLVKRNSGYPATTGGKSYFVKVDSLTLQCKLQKRSTWQGHSTQGSYTLIQSNLKAYYTLKSKRTSYSTPYDGTVSGQSFSKAVKTFNKGALVEVSQTVKNKHSNTWMKVAGSTTQFLYSSWLDYQYSITNDKDMGSYTVTKNTYRYATPFTTLVGRTAMKKSTVVNVTGSAVNKNGTLFYRVQAGNANVWMLASTLKKNVTYAQPQFTETTHINGPTLIYYGTGHGLRGEVKVNCGKITKVTAQIINTSTKAVKISFVATPNATTFNINGTSASDKGTQNGGTAKMNVNNAITFGSLPRGTYQYVLTFTAVNGNKKTTWTKPVSTFTVK